MKLLNLKAIPIAHDKNVYYLNKKELDVIKKIEYRQPEPGFHLSKSISLLEHKPLASLKKSIIKKANEYTRNILEIKDDIYMTQSWSTINITNAFHKLHTHANTFISIVYYAQCEAGHIGFDLGTTSIRECFNFDYTVNKFNIYNSETWELVVRTGDIVLFPGHIRHQSTPNKAKQDRIIVGANFFIRGTLGSKGRVSLMTI